MRYVSPRRQSVDDLTIPGEMRADAPPAGRRMRWRRRRFVVISSVLVAAAAVACVWMAQAAPAVRPLPAGETILLNSKTVLEEAAKAVEKRPAAPEPRADQWQYTKMLNVQPADGRVTTRESWLRYDGKQSAGRDLQGTFQVRDVPSDPGDDDLSPQQYRKKLLKLPADPDKLLAHVRGDRHWVDYPKEKGVSMPPVEDPDTRAYRILSLYLTQQAVMPPQVEAAIFRAMAKIPGVRVEQGVKDAVGSVGLGLSRSATGDEGQRRYLILDPRTYRVMADQTLYLRDEVLDGEVVSRRGSVFADVWLDSAVVDKPGDIS